MPYTAPSPFNLAVEDPFRENPAYFVSLSSLENYMRYPPSPPLPCAIPLRRRPKEGEEGKLVICHDMAGNYLPDEHEPMWTFPWWGMADVFIYFSHHRVSPPPRAWINAGHRQACRVLGALMFEPGNGEDEQYRLFLDSENNLCTSYADYLIDLCEQRGFDGWLVNLELRYYSHIPVFLDWLRYLTSQSRTRLGERSCLIWYDSITVWGWKSHQNTLTRLNAPFFLASDMLHTNYWYDQHKIRAARELLDSAEGHGRTQGEVAFGIDMWGRRTYKDGGYKACLAIDDVRAASPRGGGFSTSLFAPAYLWECGELYTRPGTERTRETWWERETLFWVGRGSKEEEERDLRLLNTDNAKQFRAGEVFHPIKRYVPFKPQPLPLTTTFSLGAGNFFNIEGVPVPELEMWSDHELVSPLPDLAMPISLGVVQKTGEEILIRCDVVEDARFAWFGAQCLRVTLPVGVGKMTCFVPLFSVDCGEEPESVTAELTWAQDDADSSGPSVVGWSTSASNAPNATNSVLLPSTTAVTWNRTTSGFSNMSGIIRLGIIIALGPTSTGSLFIGAASIRRTCQDMGTLAIHSCRHRHPAVEQLAFVFSPRVEDYEGTLTWKTKNVHRPERSGPASLDDEVLFREVSVWTTEGGGTRTRLCWGTTSTDTFRFSWKEAKAQEILREAEGRESPVQVTIRLRDGCGYRVDTSSCSSKLLLLARKVVGYEE